MLQGSEAGAAFSDRRILVVEDEPMLLYSFEDGLKDLGCAGVFGASNEPAARAVLENEDIDLVILDVHLRAETSFRLADALEALNIPFVFLSGSQGEEIPDKFRHKPFVGKPFLEATLEEALLRALKDKPVAPPAGLSLPA